MVTDPIADMLTIVRNAYRTRKKTATVPGSNIKKQICRILYESHFISKYAFVADDKQGLIKILLKYDGSLNSAIQGIRRISSPGHRQYRKSADMPKVLNGMGIAIVSTPKGLMTDRECRKQNLGGEVIAHVW